MRSLVRWVAGLVGIAALAKLLGRRRHAGPPPDPFDGADPAEELRRKLAEVRTTAPAGAADEPPAPEPAAETAESASQPTIEERRAEIHARAQEAIEAMRETET